MTLLTQQPETDS